MIKLLWGAAALGLLSVGQSIAQETRDSAPARNAGWTLGAGVIVSDSELAGEGARVLPIPLIGYESDRFFLRGLDAGVHLFNKNNWKIDLQLSARLTGWDANDLGVTELSRRGVDRALLDDRDFGVDAGVAFEWVTRFGKWKLKSTSDVSGASDGSSLQIGYSVPVAVGRGVLETGVRATYWSDSLANYYYGTSLKEASRGVPRYSPGSLVMPELSIVYVRPINQRWLGVAAVEGRSLPSEVRGSPLVEADRNSAVSASVFFIRSF